MTFSSMKHIDEDGGLKWKMTVGPHARGNARTTLTR